jgi:regulatory protein
MLARKGYGGGLAGYVVREALDARGDADEPDIDLDPLGLGEDALLP